MNSESVAYLAVPVQDGDEPTAADIYGHPDTTPVQTRRSERPSIVARCFIISAIASSMIFVLYAVNNYRHFGQYSRRDGLFHQGHHFHGQGWNHHHHHHHHHGEDHHGKTHSPHSWDHPEGDSHHYEGHRHDQESTHHEKKGHGPGHFWGRRHHHGHQSRSRNDQVHPHMNFYNEEEFSPEITREESQVSIPLEEQRIVYSPEITREESHPTP